MTQPGCHAEMSAFSGDFIAAPLRPSGVDAPQGRLSAPARPADYPGELEREIVLKDGPRPAAAAGGSRRLRQAALTAWEPRTL